MDNIKVTDYEAVLATITKYTDACKEGKSEIMKPAFTENALMYGYLNGEYYHGSIEALYGAVDAFGAAPETTARVDVLSIEGTAAVARVTLEDWHGLAFTDFHSLVKEEGEWKILAKVFHQYL
nr:nuclear transport factor 2 family protein [uncultured Ruminococcus sp.]